MSSSYSFSNTTTFTVTHAKQLAAKVAADLKRIQRFYGEPSDRLIDMYEEELVEYLKSGFLQEVSYGYQRNSKWITPTLKYIARDIELLAGTDNDPGKVRPGADVAGASFCSFLIYNSKMSDLTSTQRENFIDSLPFRRGSADEPDSDGYFSNDLMYYSGGRSLNRSSLQ